jgi:uncharacterized beta barrel domain-containing protein DUF5777
MIRLSMRTLGLLTMATAFAAPVFAQTPPATQTTPPPAVSEDDAVLKPAEPDFTLISLPTSLRVPLHKSAFRVTHRFTRPISCDSCPNSFAADGFGTDGGAVIGLEYRVGIVPNGEIGVYRTADKTVELFGQYGLVRQGARAPIEASVLAAVDASNVGRHNTDSEYSPTLGVILTRLVGDQAALYVEPMWVHHTNLFERATVSDDDTVLVGIGARVRIRPTVYLVGEYSPRVSGYKPGTDAAAFGIEKRAGGHMFQLNFSNAFGTTLSQIARGGSRESQADGSLKTNWYMGFNITRKFF